MVVFTNATAQTVTVRPSVDARLTFTDNSSASREKKTDWIGEVSPGIVISRDRGRISGNLNARLRNTAYASDSDRNATFVALQGLGQIEAIERTLFVDMGATISRNNRSGLTGRASEDFLGTDSANETRLFSIGPRLHFRLGGETQGVVSYAFRWFDGGGATVRRTVGDWRGQLSNPLAFGRVGWALDYSRTDSSYDDAANNEVSEETARASLLFSVTPQLRLRGIVGYESNDYSVRSGESGDITGMGFDWYPTDRTVVSGATENRIFGRGYNLSVSHRQALSVWNVSLSRDISSSLQTTGSVFDDPAFRSLFDALAGEIPDPFEREAFARQQLGYPAPGVRDAFVTNNFFVARVLRGSVSLRGARNVLTFALQSSERSRLGSPLVSDPRDDLSSFDIVSTESGTVALSHSLSPLATMNASFVRSRSSGSGPSRAHTNRSLLSVGISTRLGPDTTGGLTYRFQQADGASDFTENVLTANVGMQF